MTDREMAVRAFNKATAERRAREAKERVDEAQRVLDAAEDEWHQACLTLDRIEAEQDREQSR